MIPRTDRRVSLWTAGLAILLLVALAGCGSSNKKDKSTSTDTSGSTITTPTVSMDFPASLTGGSGAGMTNSVTARHLLADGSMSCNFAGNGQNDPFLNGYRMTKFLIAIIASWQCVTDDIMSNVAQLGFLATGQIIPIAGNGSGEPTALSITLDSATQTTLRLYYNGNTTTPGVFISWNTAAGATTGKLILGPSAMQDSKPADPHNMRMDFKATSTQRSGDMYIYFASHPALAGFRIQVAEALDGSLPTFTALGRIDSKAQWDTGYALGVPGPPFPSLAMYTVSDGAGQGAAAAIFSNVGWSLDLDLCCSPQFSGHFGYYKYDKDDRYFFKASGTSDFVNKSLVPGSTTMTGPRTSPNGPTIQAFLGLPAGYFVSGGQCVTVGDDCAAFLERLFLPTSSSWPGQEPNGGSDPQDWRSTILAGVDSSDMLSSVLPPGAATWGDAFTMTFTP